MPPYGSVTEPLGPDFYDRPVLQVAPELLGAVIEHGGVAVRLTEVEAYDGARDPGSHAYRGQTPRTAVMFGPPGGLYVYFTYGMHHCANLVCGPVGRASAVLLRAGEVIGGADLARARRAAARPASARAPGARPVDRDLARGPARLATCLGFTREQNGILTTRADSPVRVRGGVRPDPTLRRTGPRVGVAGEGGDGGRFAWRFWLAGEPTVSPYRAAVPRRPRA